MVRIIQNYTLYEVIGEGAYGKVYRAINKLDNKEYAVKVIEVKKFQTNKKLEECTVHEINILTNIEKNKHIITYYDMLKTQNNFYFVYEYCNGGTLEGILRKEEKIEEKKALVIFRQLLEAFQVLNKYNIMHRDLKPDNIFFHNGVVKVGDFGFCKSLEKAEMTKTMLGSPIYMAPEILNGEIYSNKADIWSLGVVLYEMLYGYCPFESNSIPKLIEVLKETELEFPSDTPVSNEAKILLKKILTKDPSRRIEWMELFQLKISPEGKLLEQTSKLSLAEDGRNLLRTVREINETNEHSDTSTSSSISSPSTPGNHRSYNPTSINSYSTYSPRSVPAMDKVPQQAPQTYEDRNKAPLMKKAQGGVEEGETIAIKRQYSDSQKSGAREKALKFHQEVFKAINIIRSMAHNNEKHTPLFSCAVLRVVSERMKSFRDQHFGPSPPQQLRQYKQIFDQQIDDVDYELAMMRSKVEDFSDWKKVAKAKFNQVKNMRLFYEMIMYLSQEPASENVSPNEMRNLVRLKIG